jgi:hypothetical protein
VDFLMSSEEFAKQLMDVINEGRAAAIARKPRESNPYHCVSHEEETKRIVWDAGWIYVAGVPVKR